MCSVRLLVSDLAQAKYVTPAFNSTRKCGKLAGAVLVLQKYADVVTSRCSCAEDDRDLKRTCTDIVPLGGGVLVAVAVLGC